MTPRRGLALVLVVSAAFFAIWWNRYAPPTSGGEAVVIERGPNAFLPYRNFFLQAPPGVPMLVQAITAVGGPHLLGILSFGALWRIAGASALFGLLLRVSRPSFAAVGTLTALIVSSTDISDTPFYYNHLGAGFVLVATHLGSIGAEGRGVPQGAALVCAGALLVFAVAVKQTLVFASVGAVVALVVLAWPRPQLGWAKWAIALLAGAAAMLASIWIWLFSHGLVNAMLAAMQRAPEGKGGVARSLFRPFVLLWSLPNAVYATVVAWIVIGILVGLWILHGRRPDRLPILYLSAIGIGVATLATFPGDSRLVTLFLTALGWWGSLALAGLHLAPALMRRDDVNRAVVALGILSFAMGYSFAVSWPLFENIAFPGLALVFAAMLERPPTLHPRRWVAAILFAAFGAVCVASVRKATFPHSWGFWIEPPIYSPRGDFQHPVLLGMRPSEASSDLYAIVSQVAQQFSGPDDAMYVFPNMPIMYAIAGRLPATYGLAHWIDICPDFLGKEDSQRLKTQPPKLLIVREDPVEAIEIEEWLYRGGARSSVRDILQAIDQIKPMYDKVQVFVDPATYPIVFYVRRDAPR